MQLSEGPSPRLQSSFCPKQNFTPNSHVVHLFVVDISNSSNLTLISYIVLPGGSAGKESACNVGDLGSIPGSGRSPGEGNDNPLQYLAWTIPRTEEPGRLQSMRLSRQEHWSGLSFPSPGDLPNPGIEPRSLALQKDSLPSEPPGKPKNTGVGCHSLLQGIFPTQGSNLGLLHCGLILYCLSHQGSP